MTNIARKRKLKDDQDAEERRLIDLRKQRDEERQRSEAAQGAGGEQPYLNRTDSDDNDGPARPGNKRQLGLLDSMNRAQKIRVDKAVATWVYEAGLPFSVAASPPFREMLNELCAYGKRTGLEHYSPPGRDRLRGSLLETKVAELEKDMDGMMGE